jgi:1-deoxy-D-xylulose-5-phosphate synthase
MYTATLEKNAGPFSIRYPRGHGTTPNWKTPFTEIKIGKGRKLKEGSELAIISIGTVGNMVTKAIENMETNSDLVAHYDLRFVKPIDEEMLHEVFSKFKKVITIEDGTIVGGAGSAILEFMAANNYSAKVKMLGMPDKITEHGEPSELYAECGYDAKSIKSEIYKLLVESEVLA